MNSSLLGSAVGILIAAALVIYTSAIGAGERQRAIRQGGVVGYPRPDWRNFMKTVATMAAFLAFLHWLPEIIWLLATRNPSADSGLSERRYEAILFVGHAIALVAVTTNLLGNLWSTWNLSNRNRMRGDGSDA